MLNNELEIRLSFFFSVLIITMLLEYFFSKRELSIKRNIRWFRNFSLIVINSAVVRLFIPMTAASVAIYTNQQNIGLFNLFQMNFIVKIIVSILLLDLIIYTQHVIFHYVPIFWRLHKVHHIDQDIDVTTGLRFHPIEIILSTLIKCASVLLLGTPFIAVVFFEIILNATAMFNHGNISLPHKLDKYLRLILVTPDMHRVHHSVIISETNSNFGFSIPLWDRLFKTYIAQPKEGHQNMIVGLNQYKDLDINKTNLLNLLIIPFKKQGSV